MLFTEPAFLFLFLPAVLLLHAVLPGLWRNLVLLCFSLVFYAWGEGIFLLVMLSSIGLNYTVGLALGRPGGGRRRTLLLGVGANLAILGFFKYANFIAENLDVVLAACGLPRIALDPIHLPIGVSFFTFQAISYIVDVSRGAATAQRNPLHVGLYISLFPQLIAGPIVRYTQVAARIAERTVTSADFAEGARRFIIGLSKKMILANTAAVRADQIFALSPELVTAPVAWLGLACYTLQIYFDFSGYSDMAIGLGRMLGFRFLENFNYPYISQSITEFWRRWHISLSSWFRDYLYVPLGGNRISAATTYRNLLVVFVLCGLWHGASWNFLIWGLFHGLFLVVERLGGARWVAAAPRPLRHAYTLLAVVVGWVFFRADTLPAAVGFLASMAGLSGATGDVHRLADFLDVLTVLTLVIGVVAATPILPWLGERLRAYESARDTPNAWLDAGRRGAALACLTLLFLGCTALIAADTHNPFIYFRF